jgi:Response regulator containing CheY-like receiver domain and AraC-type DNA-binding domain
MNILVVDDEYYIVQGITRNINWDRLGIDTVYTAYSMKQAQEVFKQHTIDILLTDIEMQKGSGLDLISWANDHSFDPVKILLTGHQNFSYAQKAIVLRCFEYLIKPVEPTVLEEELLRAAVKVRENNNLKRAKNIAASWDANQALRMETFWREIYINHSDKNSIIEVMQRFSVPVSWLEDSFYYFFINVHAKSVENDAKNISPEELAANLTSVFEVNIDMFLYKISSSKFALAVNSSKFTDYQDAFQFCEYVLGKLVSHFIEFRITIFLSDMGPLTSAALSYQMLNNFESNILTTENIVIPVHNLDASYSQEFSDSQLKNIPLTRWSELLLKYSSPQIMKDIKEEFKAHSAYYPVKMLIALYYGVLQTVFSALESKEISMNELFPKLVHHTDLVKATSSMEDFLFWAEHLLSEAENILTANADSATFVDSVKKYIRANLHSEDLNRNNIAEELHMNSDYLSYLFHKQSGQLLSTYIINERIQSAKKLLLTSDLSLQEIADQTGFSGSSYFHKQFRKITGMTPQQYKNSSTTDSPL